MILTTDEQAILNGDQGAVLQKVIRTVITYGDTFAAQQLVPLQGNPHLVGSFGANTITPYFEMLDELIAAGLKTQMPFTVDPRPMEYETIDPGLFEKIVFNLIFGKQKTYEVQLQKLGLKDERAFSCACYLPEIGNTPSFGANLAWSESSAVVYANSVLGARSNRNSAGIDLMCAILGKAPLFGLMTEEGRQAAWAIEIKTSHLPNPQLLGSAVGLRVMEDVPYLIGLDRFLGKGLTPFTESYLKDFGAACASNGAVGLYHIENITPEAIASQRGLLRLDVKTYVIDDAELDRVYASYPLLWKNPQARPSRVFIGCPHLSAQQIDEWVEKISTGLTQNNQSHVTVPTYLFASPDLAASYRQNQTVTKRLLAMGIHLTSICPLMYMNNPLCARQPIVTNSNKLRTYTSARFYLDEDVLKILLTGNLPNGGAHEHQI